MNNRIATLRNINSRYLIPIFILLAILGNWIDDWYYFISLALVATFFSSLKFFHDKKWIASADKYTRVIFHSPFLEQVIRFLFFIALTFVFIYFRHEIENQELLKMKTTFGLTFLPGIIHLGDYFHKFIDSIKTFDEGIQLPGRKSEIIPWNEIYAFTEVDDTVSISSSKGEHEFNIDPADYRYTRAIIADWKLKNGRKSFWNAST